MTITSFTSLFASLALTACAATPSPAPSTPAPAPNATVPDGWSALAGPHATLEAACAGCQLSPIRALPAGAAFVAVAQGSRGLDSVIALQTPRGWYVETREPMPPMHSHHEPRSVFYELERTRVADGVVVRMVDHQSVFYPGQGNAGSSHTAWFDRTCRAFGDLVACSAPTSVASKNCTRDRRSDGTTNEECSGEAP